MGTKIRLRFWWSLKKTEPFPHDQKRKKVGTTGQLGLSSRNLDIFAGWTNSISHHLVTWDRDETLKTSVSDKPPIPTAAKQIG